jgi:hypothetical protein
MTHRTKRWRNDRARVVSPRASECRIRPALQQSTRLSARSQDAVPAAGTGAPPELKEQSTAEAFKNLPTLETLTLSKGSRWARGPDRRPPNDGHRNPRPLSERTISTVLHLRSGEGSYEGVRFSV